MSDDPAPLKPCSSCGIPKPRTREFFSPDKKNGDKLCSNCKQCRNDKAKARRQSEKEADAIPLPPVPEGYKRCRECKEVKLATAKFFNKTPVYKSPDCLQSQCIECRKKYRREYNKSTEKVIKPKSEKKWCPGCKQEWPATLKFFNYNKATRDRLTYYCKQCGGKQSKIYRDRPGGKEERRTYRQSRKEQDKIYHKNYRKQHQEHERHYGKWYRETHKESDRIYRRLYNQTHKEQRRVNTLNRIARKKAVQGVYTPAQIAEQLKRQHYHCYYAACGHAKFKKERGKYVYEIEHTYPLSRVVGTSIPANDMGYIVLACPSCNMSKGTKFPWEWVEGGRLL